MTELQQRLVDIESHFQFAFHTMQKENNELNIIHTLQTLILQTETTNLKICIEQQGHLEQLVNI